jgi:hypothetical protein
MACLLDTSVFIEAKDRHYGFDFCPAFWAWIDHALQAGTVFSIDRVAIELGVVDDDLTDRTPIVEPPAMRAGVPVGGARPRRTRLG